jgi:hypothetical protein
MKARFSLSTLLAALVAMIGVTSVSAQNTYDRLSVVEQFTSATCGPCVAAGPVMAKVISLANGSVSIRYHMNFPAPGDPWNVANPAENASRQTYYAVNGIPTARVNGKATVDPRNETALVAGINADNGAKSPARVTVTQTGATVKVKVETNVDLKAHKLHVALVSRKTELPNLGSQLGNWNGETEFGDAMLKMMPNAAGTNLQLDANSSKEFDFSFTPGQGQLWPEGQQYVVAFIQANANKEIIQGGSNLNELFARLEMSSTKWQYITKGESKSATVTVSNPGKSDLEVEMTVANAADLTQAGWNVSLSNDVLALPAGGSKTVTVNATAPGRSSFAGIIVEAKPVNVTSGIARASSIEHGYLTEGARVAVWAGASEGAVLSAIGALASSHGSDAVYIPLAQEILEAFDPTAFDAAIFPAGFDGRFNMVAFTPIMEAMQSAGKGVWMQAPVGLAVAFNAQNQSNPGYPETKAWFERMGLSLKETKGRLNSAQTKTLSFKTDGVAGDVIGDKWTATVNRSQFDETSPVNWPFYTSATDIMTVSPTAPTVGFAYSDGLKPNIIGVRSTVKGKAVFTSFGPELIPAEAERNTLTQKVLDWLLQGNAPGLALSTSTMNFGEIKAESKKDLTLKITNPGSATLEISSVAVAGVDPDAFEIKSGGPSMGTINVEPKADHSIVITFKPNFEGDFSARLEIESNVGSTSTVSLVGKASAPTSVETESTTASGALSLRLVGSNPVTSSSAVEVMVNGAGTEDVTLTVVDVAGRTVGTIFDGSMAAGTQRFNLNAAELGNGMYTVVATTGSERAAITVISNR